MSNWCLFNFSDLLKCLSGSIYELFCCRSVFFTHKCHKSIKIVLKSLKNCGRKSGISITQMSADFMEDKTLLLLTCVEKAREKKTSAVQVNVSTHRIHRNRFFSLWMNYLWNIKEPSKDCCVPFPFVVVVIVSNENVFFTRTNWMAKKVAIGS